MTDIERAVEKFEREGDVWVYAFFSILSIISVVSLYNVTTIRGVVVITITTVFLVWNALPRRTPKLVVIIFLVAPIVLGFNVFSNIKAQRDNETKSSLKKQGYILKRYIPCGITGECPVYSKKNEILYLDDTGEKHLYGGKII